MADLVGTLEELAHLGVGFVSLTEALDMTTATGRAMAAFQCSLSSNTIYSASAFAPASPRPSSRASGSAVLGLWTPTPGESANSTVPVSAKLRSPAG